MRQLGASAESEWPQADAWGSVRRCNGRETGWVLGVDTGGSQRPRENFNRIG